MDHVAAASEEAEGWCKNQGNQDNKSTGPGCDKTYHGGSGNPALKLRQTGDARDPATLEAGKINGCSLLLETNGKCKGPGYFRGVKE
jgi:hypothetical protein